MYLVRHAETLVESRDRPFTAAGRERAELLSDIFRDAGITHIHTTDFERTRGTAKSISDRLGIEPRLYSEVEDPADGLRDTTGKHLVIGNTNRTSQLERLFGGVSTDIPLHENDPSLHRDLEPRWDSEYRPAPTRISLGTPFLHSRGPWPSTPLR